MSRPLTNSASSPDAGPSSLAIGCVSFTLGKQRWAARLDGLRRVLPPPEVCIPLPNSPPWVCGMALIETDIVTVLDPARFLDAQAAASSSLQRMIFTMTYQDEVLAMLVEDCGAITAVEPDEIVDLLPERRPDDLPWLGGLYRPRQTASLELRGIAGFLDITGLMAACVAILESESE